LDKFLDIYMKALEVLITAMLVAMVVLVFGNVAMRYGLNSGITVSEELSRWLFVWVTFLGSIIAMRENSHLGSNFIVRMFGPGGRRAFLILGRIAMIYICWLVFEGSREQTVINLSVSAPITGMSMGAFYSSGMVFSVSGALILLGDIYRLARCAPDEIDRFLDETGEQA